MKNGEHKLQCACIKWFKYQYPIYANLIFAIPNGGNRDVRTGAMLKAEGVLSGVPDLFLACPNKLYHGLFIEMKFGENKLTKHQLKQITLFAEQKYECAVCCSFEEFEEVVNLYFK